MQLKKFNNKITDLHQLEVTRLAGKRPIFTVATRTQGSSITIA